MEAKIILNLFFVLLTILSIPSSSSSAVIDYNELLTMDYKRMFNKNFISSIKFRCQPQPRAFLATELFKDNLYSAHKIIPSSFVLHRCDTQSGCCQDNQICGESQSQEVTLVFRFDNQLEKEKPIYRAISMYNHTQCKCTTQIYEPKRLPDVVNLQFSTSASNSVHSSIPYLFMYIKQLFKLFIYIIS